MKPGNGMTWGVLLIAMVTMAACDDRAPPQAAEQAPAAAPQPSPEQKPLQAVPRAREEKAGEARRHLTEPERAPAAAPQGATELQDSLHTPGGGSDDMDRVDHNDDAQTK